MLWRHAIVPGALAIAAAAVGLAGCSEDEANEPETRSLCPGVQRQAGLPARPGVVVLDDSGRLTRYSVPGADVLATRRFPAPPQAPGLAGARLSLPGRYLAPASSGTEIAMLQREVAPSRDILTILDARTLRPRCRFPLAVGNRYRAVTATGDRLIAFGNRPAGEKKNAAL